MISTMRSLATTAAVLAGAALSAAPAAAWPERTVTLVTPFAAGGTTDILARLTAERLQKRLGQPFIVEPAPGGAGSVAAQRVLKATHDGYSLYFATASQIAVLPYTNTINFDPQKDFKPVSIIATNPFVITTGKMVPARTLEEFIAHVKANPGKLPFGSAGVGNFTHLSAALFLKTAGIEMNHVPYRGNAPAFQDLIAGHIAMISLTPVEVRPHLGKDDVKLLGVTDDKPVPGLPGVPAIKSKLPAMPSASSWNAVLAPSGTPQAVIDTLSREIMAAARDPEFRAQIEKHGLEPVVHAPAEFGRIIAADSARWRDLIRDMGITPAPVK